LSDTDSLQSGPITRGIEPSIIQKMQHSINAVNDSSLKILNSHSTGTNSHESATFNPEIIEIAFAVGSVYQATIKGMNYLFNVSIKENSKHTNSLFFDKVEWSKHIIQLKHPIDIDVVYTDGFLEGHNEELDIFLAASDIEQLRSDFEEEFFVMWDVYSKEPDEKLTKKAREIKYKILDLVMGVSVEV